MQAAVEVKDILLFQYSLLEASTRKKEEEFSHNKIK